MAIGIPLPPFHDSRMRLPWRYAPSVFARPRIVLRAAWLRVVSVSRVLWKRLVNAVEDVLQLRARARQRQRAQLNVFENQYENLVDLLCISAHEGVRPDRQRAYTAMRTWMFAHYPCIAKHVREEWQSNGLNGNDPFRALFAHKCLDDAVNTDTGIEDITRCRAALEAYRARLDSTLL